MQKKKLLAFFLALALAGGIGTYYYAGAKPEKFGSKVEFVSGTEYMANESAQTIVRVTNALGMGLSADWCNVSIVYPNRTVNVTTNTAMTQNGLDGSWNYAWTAPDIYGIYEQYAECKVGGRVIGNSKASHVSEALSIINKTEEIPVAVVIS
jgi:hypothetical protein